MEPFEVPSGPMRLPPKAKAKLMIENLESVESDVPNQSQESKEMETVLDFVPIPAPVSELHLPAMFAAEYIDPFTVPVSDQQISENS